MSEDGDIDNDQKGLGNSVDELCRRHGNNYADLSYTIKLPDYEWQMAWDSDFHALVVSFERGYAPNWFYRLTGRLFLGLHWRRVK